MRDLVAVLMLQHYFRMYSEVHPGFLVPVRGVSEAADRLTALLTQPSLRHSLGEKAYNKIKTQFNISTTVQEYEKLYLINGRSA